MVLAALVFHLGLRDTHRSISRMTKHAFAREWSWGAFLLLLRGCKKIIEMISSLMVCHPWFHERFGPFSTIRVVRSIAWTWYFKTVICIFVCRHAAFIYACLTPCTSDKDRSLTTSCSVPNHGRNLLEYCTCCYQNFKFVCQIKGGHKTKTVWFQVQ